MSESWRGTPLGSALRARMCRELEQVLHRRGVFATDRSRLGAANGYTEQDHRELESVLAGVASHFTL